MSLPDLLLGFLAGFGVVFILIILVSLGIYLYTLVIEE